MLNAEFERDERVKWKTCLEKKYPHSYEVIAKKIMQDKPDSSQRILTRMYDDTTGTDLWNAMYPKNFDMSHLFEENELEDPSNMSQLSQVSDSSSIYSSGGNVYGKKKPFNSTSSSNTTAMDMLAMTWIKKEENMRKNNAVQQPRGSTWMCVAIRYDDKYFEDNLCFFQTMLRKYGSKVVNLTNACAAHANIDRAEYFEPQFYVLKDPTAQNPPEMKYGAAPKCWKECMLIDKDTEIDDILVMHSGQAPKIIIDFGYKKFDDEQDNFDEN